MRRRIFMENRRPVVYVARAIYAQNGAIQKDEIATFVSKAYLRSSFLKYSKEGKIDAEYHVDFSITPYIVPIDAHSEFSVQNGNDIKVFKIFTDYKSCRKYVEQLNMHNYSHVLSSYLYEKAVNYGKGLENRYIPQAERGEKTNEYIYSK